MTVDKPRVSIARLMAFWQISISRVKGVPNQGLPYKGHVGSPSKSQPSDEEPPPLFFIKVKACPETSFRKNLHLALLLPDCPVATIKWRQGAGCFDSGSFGTWRFGPGALETLAFGAALMLHLFVGIRSRSTEARGSGRGSRSTIG